MKEIVYQKIRTQITRSKYGEVFMVSSFPKYNVEYVTKLLAIFEKEGSEGQVPDPLVELYFYIK